ncbi:hypothetical protein BGZ95_005938 [Linnemannia exigua]|uniref:F-box domain-containing protein n=1 Tax=Linnemannia exigua TaxID=604196 RepID=A0AAD4H1B3_9FUNG|nr:hypothetical protein BGZ95_005938 [Linnemannia exigua]
MTGISDIPQELIVMIADYLSRKDRHRLASTCRNHYQALISRLWKELYIESDFPHFWSKQHQIAPVKPIITSRRVEQHAPYVHLLRLHGPFQQEYYALKFPRLHTLIFLHDFSFHTPCNGAERFDSTLDIPMWHDVHINNANLIRLNPTIKNLQIDLGRPNPIPSASFWEAISTTLHNPSRLCVSGFCPASSNTLNSFWKACNIFEELDIKVDLNTTELLSQLDFPRLRRIALNVVPGWGGLKFDIQEQLAWLRRCHNLTKLDWKLTSHRLPKEFMEALEQRTWPHLEDLSLGDFHDSVDIRTLSSRLPSLRRFRLRSDQFQLRSDQVYALSFTAFQKQLFGKIRVLDMAHSFGFTSRMSLGVLEECVHLNEFKTFVIDAEDIDLESRPWVCLNLKRLEALIKVESDESHEDAFDALSRLTHLEHLDSGLDKLTVSEIEKHLPGENNYLQWSLDSGLDRLSTLTKLRTIGFADTDQEMTEEELEWMFDSWPLLEEVKGEFSGDDGYHSALVDMLHERHISHV